MSTSTKDFVLGIIEIYRNSPCLWQVTNEDYHNKHKRNTALQQLLTLFKTKDPNANLDTVKKRLAAMRNSFKKEFNKVKNSSRSGIATDEIHIPKLWYYKDMLFLTDIDTPRPSTSIHSILDDMPIWNEDELEIDRSLRDTSPAPSPAPSPEPSPRPLQKKKKKTTTQADELLSKISRQMDEPSLQVPHQPRERYAAYGEHVAEKLRNMSNCMSMYVQKLINDAIFLGDTDMLNISSHIATQNEPASNTTTTPTTTLVSEPSQTILGTSYAPAPHYGVDSQDTVVAFEEYMQVNYER